MDCLQANDKMTQQISSQKKRGTYNEQHSWVSNNVMELEKDIFVEAKKNNDCGEWNWERLFILKQKKFIDCGEII